MMLQALGNTWANSAPQGAVDFARDLRTKDSRLYDEFISSLLHHVTQYAPKLAVELVMDMDPKSNRRSGLFSSLASRLSRVDVHAGIEWLEQLDQKGESEELQLEVHREPCFRIGR